MIIIIVIIIDAMQCIYLLKSLQKVLQLQLLS